MIDPTAFEAAWDEELDGVGTPARRRRPRRRHRTFTVLAVAAVASLFGMTAAWAYTPAFNDNAGTPFQSEIDWLGWTGISQGYPDGSFRPTQNISRQGLAAWMQRMFNVRDDQAIWFDNTTFSTTTSANFVELPDAAVAVTIPEGTSGSIVANFTAETVCFGAVGYCSAQMFVRRSGGPGGFEEMEPTTGSNFAFDSSDSNTEGSLSWAGHAFQRTSSLVFEGTYEVIVRVKAMAGGTFQVDDWSLVVDTTLNRTDAPLS